MIYILMIYVSIILVNIAYQLEVRCQKNHLTSLQAILGSLVQSNMTISSDIVPMNATFEIADDISLVSVIFNLL